MLGHATMHVHHRCLYMRAYCSGQACAVQHVHVVQLLIWISLERASVAAAVHSSLYACSLCTMLLHAQTAHAQGIEAMLAQGAEKLGPEVTTPTAPNRYRPPAGFMNEDGPAQNEEVGTDFAEPFSIRPVLLVWIRSFCAHLLKGL